MLSMNRIYDTPLTIRDGTVFQPGLHEHKNGKIIARTGSHIVIKWPSGSNHSRPLGRSVYYPPATMVFAIEEETTFQHQQQTVESIKVHHLISWDHTRKSKQTAATDDS